MDAVDRELLGRLWPAWRSAWVVHDDGTLLVVDKPAGVPSMAARPEEVADDVASRLRAWLAERDGVPPEQVYLGVHHRLDRDTSGLLLFARRREANAALARAFETHRVERGYLAAVRLAAGQKVPGRIDRPLRRARDHRRMEVAPRGARGSQPARTRCALLERRGEMALLRAEPETGRTHQIRVHLASAGLPVAGDPLYEGPPAPRLMLHAETLSLEHPLGGERLRLTAPRPASFEAWLRGHAQRDPREPGALRAALAQAMPARWGLGHSASGPRPTTAFRLLHGEGEGLPGVAVDRYGPFALVQVDEALGEALARQVAATVAELGFAGVYLQRRPRRLRGLSAAQRRQLAPAEPVAGRPAPAPLVVLEEGLPLEVTLGDGFATSLYTDQREARRWLRARCDGASVLNLFGYTGAFTVAAAAGGARRTLTVDASAPALRQAERNLALGGYGGAHRFARGDVFEVLEVVQAAGDCFDFVVLDPPTYGASRRGRWRSARDWPRLVAAAARVTAPGGWLYASSNDRRLSARALRDAVLEGVRRAGRDVASLRPRPAPIDYPHFASGEPHLRAWLVRLGP